MSRLCISLVLLNFSILAYLNAQSGGQSSFSLLESPVSARLTSLGGYAIGIVDRDPNLGLVNPALINARMHHTLGINHNFHFADITQGSSSFVLAKDSTSTPIAMGASYTTYGDFIRTDEFGDRNGEFTGRDIGISIGTAYALDDRLSVGLMGTLLQSRLEQYRSMAASFTFGAIYQYPSSQSSLSLVIQNVGFQITRYTSIRESVPLNIIVSYTKRLRYVPFRFSLTAHHLNRWDLRNPYQADDDPIFIGEVQREPGSWDKAIDNFFRHFVFGGELLLGQNEVFVLRFGYNHNRRKDLSVSAFRNVSGFSLGFGLRIKKIRLDYGVGYYHLAGGVNHLSVLIDLQQLFSRL